MSKLYFRNKIIQSLRGHSVVSFIWVLKYFLSVLFKTKKKEEEMLDICFFKWHAGVGGGTHQSWQFLFLIFCILLGSLSIWFVYLFLLLLLHLASVNLWPSFLFSFFFLGLKKSNSIFFPQASDTVTALWLSTAATAAA